MFTAVKNFIFGSLCSQCEHKNVCKYFDESKDKCDDFKEPINIKLHRSIYEMFEPIFNWMQYHYPAGGVTFYVEHNKAQMHLDYNVSVYEKKLLQPMQDIIKQNKEKEKSE